MTNAAAFESQKSAPPGFQRTHVEAAALHRHHLHRRVLQARGAVALEALERLVGHPLVADGEDGEVLALVLQQDLVVGGFMGGWATVGWLVGWLAVTGDILRQVSEC